MLFSSLQRNFGAAFLLVGVLAGVRALSQSQISDASLLSEFRALSGPAATVFVGQIVSIERKGGSMEVCFRVEQPVRGTAGTTFRMREWGGLWAPGSNRYTPGSRVLAFVHGTASGSGFSSPIHGAEGLVPVVVQGAQTAALVDLRRVAASVLRSPSTPLLTEENGAFRLPELLEFLAGRRSAEDVQRVQLPGGKLHARARLPGALQVQHGPLMPSRNGGDVGSSSAGLPTAGLPVVSGTTARPRSTYAAR